MLDPALLQTTRVYLFVFGVLTVAGGTFGYLKAKSRPSLIAGSIAGVLLVLAGWLITSNARAGLVLGLVVSLALAARFGRAFAKTKKPMPAGLMALLGIVGVILTALALFG
jgi:uncharacterized membrane protein (UPF0136 family)